MASKPARPRAAASVILLRDGPRGIEIYMMVRHDRVPFAPGALVFPGGTVDGSDRDPRILSRCAGAETMDDAVMAFQIAAIREAFEECGILLARPRGGDALVGADRLRALESRYRVALGRREVDFRDLLVAEDLELACDLMGEYAHWITPESLPKRFDTRFFIVAAPVDQVAAHDGVESVESMWITPADLVAQSDRGEWTVMFVTRMNVERIGRSGTVAEVFTAAARQPIVTVTPRLEKIEGGRIMRIPAEAGYGASEVYDEGVESAAFGFRPMNPEKIARLRKR